MGLEEVVAKSTTVLAPQEAEPGTLREVVAVLGPHALRLVTGVEEHLDAVAGEPLVHGAGEPMPVEWEGFADSLLLLTGGRSERGDLAAGLRQVAAAGGRTVVVKSWGDDLEGPARVAAECGITLLCTPDEMAWRHLDAMVTTARAAAVTIGEETASPAPGDLFGLANAIAASMGGAVTVEETSGRLIAYSSLPNQEIDEIRRLAILGRQTPERPGNAEEYQAILKSQGPVLLESSDPAYADRMGIAVRAGHEALGVIFVLANRPGLVEGADRILVDAARTTALQLLRTRGSLDPDRTRRSAALRGLLDGSLDEHAASAALNLPVAESYVVAVARPRSRAGDRESDAARAADLAALHAEYWRAGATSLVESGDVVLLLPVGTVEDPDGRLTTRLRKVGSDLVTASRRSAGIELVVAFGPIVAGLGRAARSRGLATRVADVLLERDAAGSAEDAVAALGEVRSAVVLAALRDGLPYDDDELLLDPVRSVLEHDAVQGTQYAETLLTYLGCFGDVVATATQLNIHDNTARYRVRRLSERFGIDLTAGDETLVTWLQLRTAMARLHRD